MAHPVESVERFFERHGLLQPRNEGSPGGFVVAFSAGPDSTALLWALSEVAPRFGLPVFAAHLDHALDPESADRARRARRLADELGVALFEERAEVDLTSVRGAGIEAAARNARYEFLRRVKRQCEADWIAVGHHRDDQLETIIMRLLRGSGLTGLGSMSPVEGDIVRPFLGESRADLGETVRRLGLVPVRDPSNEDPSLLRSRTRIFLLPALERTSDFSGARMLRLAETARAATATLRRRLSVALDVRPTGPDGAEMDLEAFRRLPSELAPYALDALRRTAGAEYTPPATARRDLERQLASGSSIGCDCGGGWRWTSRGDRLRLARQPADGVASFSYTLRVPGELSIPEVGFAFHLRESDPAPWMFQGSRSRAAMSLPLEAGQKVVIRNRLPGDRLRPLGCRYERKLKDVLIDRHIERSKRDALPLLLVQNRIAWVPGVTIDDAFRLRRDALERPAAGERIWVAELRPQPAATR